MTNINKKDEKYIKKVLRLAEKTMDKLIKLDGTSMDFENEPYDLTLYSTDGNNLKNKYEVSFKIKKENK